MKLSKNSANPIQVKLVARNIVQHLGIWTSHQKILVCDDVSYIGGLDMTYGRFDTNEHPLFATTSEFGSQWYNRVNPALNIITEAQYNNSKGTLPRQPWHDIHCRLKGNISFDITKHFLRRWNDNKPTKEEDDINALIRTSEGPADDADSEDKWTSQLFLSYEKGRLKSIHEEYLTAIGRAKEFIYIENQFLITDPDHWSDNKNSRNKVPKAIVDRLVACEQLKVVIVIPFVPESNGPLDESFINKALLDIQCKIIQNMHSYKPLVEKYGVEGVKNKLVFVSLGKTEQSPHDGKWYSNMIYVHSKLMIVDDEYVIVGSANLNERSLDGDRDNEICVSMYNQSEQIKKFRNDLFVEHFGSELAMLYDRDRSDFMVRLSERAMLNLYLFVQKSPLVGNVILHDKPHEMSVVEQIKAFALRRHLYLVTSPEPIEDTRELIQMNIEK
ncbi:phospholipase D alpha [Acrasis kona]|uniref:phospholipase D n=1 Tax=Acrasis kona TaxID=1008807 RepID=A0AAW2ZQI8_9EUKA